MQKKEGVFSKHYQRLALAFVLYTLCFTSAGFAYAPQDFEVDLERSDLPATTTQYTDMGSLSFGSDEDFRAWANSNGFEGDGSSQNPLYIYDLNITGLSEPSLRLSNITRTWFIFEHCMFQTYLWYSALELTNVTNGLFTSCAIFGPAFLNNSSFDVIMDSYVADGVYVDDTMDCVLIGNWFDVDSHVDVNSIYTISTNVSFYVNTFLGALNLLNCTGCYVMSNLFFNSIVDDGVANTWDHNSYRNYDGIGSYIIPGIAESVDSNPLSLETVTTPIPPSFVPTTPTTTTFAPDSTIDFSLFGVICFESVVVIAIVIMRKTGAQ
ncbi:MAG: hypothetical protein ACFFER_07255 [Candidatus Thorarchaeota archaeon]